ncbi:MAG: RluA family pseudouridine synthase [Clostridiales Family XIII bacterium]|jgi:23S rRNA pseudouridine955/2504/2580 synthase|nr:RluA family pseudouridine synthase [Clostridiales Family XIII bacterium]
MQKIVITSDEENQRLDRFLKKYLRAAPLSLIYRIIRKDVKVNGRRAAIDTVLKGGDEIDLFLDDVRLEGLLREHRTVKAAKRFKVIYEDDNILIVSKPVGLLTHGDEKEKRNTLANQVLGYLLENGCYDPAAARSFTPSPVNRLDRNTTGLVIFGKNPKAIRDLNNMIRHKGAVDKYYLTVVKGMLNAERSLQDRILKDEALNRVTVLPTDAAEGRLSETKVRPVRALKGYTLVEVHLVTGRSHQIRAHLAEAGYPVIGDRKYGNAADNKRISQRFGLNSQFLHACRIEINAGRESLEYLTGMRFECALPENFANIVDALADAENENKSLKNEQVQTDKRKGTYE